MLRVGLLSLAGLALGVGVALLLLWATREVLRWQTAPKVFEVEHTAVYLTVVLGGGLGAVWGALAGVGGQLVRRDGGR